NAGNVFFGTVVGVTNREHVLSASGADDTSTIQSVLNLAGDIVFLPGNYTNAPLSITNHTHVSAYGAYFYFLPTATNFSLSWSSNGVDITWKGGTFDGQFNGDFSTGNGITVLPSDIFVPPISSKFTNRSGLNVFSQVGGVVEDVVAQNFQGYGIF